MHRGRVRMLLRMLMVLLGVTPGIGGAGIPVLVVCNEREEASVELARHYAKLRQVPEEQVLKLNCPLTEAVGREEFERMVRQPVAAWLKARGWLAQKTPLVLVTMRGVPLRVEGTLGNFGQRTREQHRENDAASVDSELACLMLPQPPETKGSVPNPAFGHDASPLRIMVGRLDGPNLATAKRLVDDAIAVEKREIPTGRALIDHAQMASHGKEYERGDTWLNTLETRFSMAGFDLKVDRGPGLMGGAPADGEKVFFYAGWYAPHVGGLVRQEAFRFQPGAVACHIHSLSAQTVRATTQRWTGALLARGAAVALGNVDEPFLSYSTHLDVFFDLLLQGHTAGEAMWKGTPRLSWMNVMIGDPLYRPFGKRN